MVMDWVSNIGFEVLKTVAWLVRRYPWSIVRTAQNALSGREYDLTFLVAFRNVDRGPYASVMNELINNSRIKRYETCNLFLPDEIRKSSSEDFFLRALDNPSFQAYKSRLQILKRERIAEWWVKWKEEMGRKGQPINDFAAYAVRRIYEFREEYGKHFNNFWLARAESLINEGVYYGEYVVLGSLPIKCC
jgi:hypothetical protein